MWKFQLFLFLIFISCNQSSNEQSNTTDKQNSTNTQIQDTKKQVDNETKQQFETPPEDSILALILPESEDGDQNLDENLPIIFSLLDGSSTDYQIIEDNENSDLQLTALFRPGTWWKSKKKVGVEPKKPAPNIQKDIERNALPDVTPPTVKPVSLSNNIPNRNRPGTNSSELLPYLTRSATGRIEPLPLPSKKFATRNNQVEFQLFLREPNRTVFRATMIEKSGRRVSKLVSLERFDNFIPPTSGKTKQYVFLADNQDAALAIQRQLGGSKINKNAGIIGHQGKFLVFGSHTSP